MNANAEEVLIGQLTVSVVGLQYYPGQNSVGEGDQIELLLEPENPFDPNAIMAVAADGLQIGYIERVYAQFLTPIILSELFEVECFCIQNLNDWNNRFASTIRIWGGNWFTPCLVCNGGPPGTYCGCLENEPPVPCLVCGVESANGYCGCLENEPPVFCLVCGDDSASGYCGCLEFGPPAVENVGVVN